jgi:small GTP-binding protein
MGKKIKTCLIGDSSVGKTSILLRIIEGQFKDNTPSTIGADYKSQTRKIEGENVEVELWDTSGQDRYRSVAKNFFRGSDGIFIVFSLAEDRSLQGLEYWIDQIKETLDSSVPKILLGNKADLKKEPSP